MTGRVDDHYRASAATARITPAKDSDPEPLVVGAISTWPGVMPNPPSERRLDMHSVPDSDTPPPPTCFNCGQPADRSSIRPEIPGVLSGVFCCPNDHIWSARWMEVS